MPTYKYKCAQCDNEEERNVAIAERDAQNCSNCNRELNRKLVFSGVVYAPTSTGGGMK